MTNALRQRDDRNQLRPVISLIGVTQTRIAQPAVVVQLINISVFSEKVYAVIVCWLLEELVEPCGFPHFYLLATAGSARLKGEGKPVT